MWIEHTRKTSDGRAAIRELKRPWMQAPVSFSSNGKANVPESVARRLIDERDDIVAVNSDDDDEGEADEERGDE